ncbi:MAG: hypothetical protein ABI216_21670 [Devosia sp.]
MSDDPHDYDDDFEDDDYDDFEDCGMGPDGQCSMAGSEWCDWDCPRSRASDRIAAMKHRAKIVDHQNNPLSEVLADALKKATP